MPDIECVDDPAVRARRPRQEQQAPQRESDPRHAPAGTGAQPAERQERRGESQQDEWPGRQHAGRARQPIRQLEHSHEPLRGHVEQHPRHEGRREDRGPADD
ncbi:MAG: hypothetical protein ACKO4Q_06215, partial [Planctomycetota bacterium]